MNIEANSIFIIEGIFLMRHEWRGFYDYRLYIDCPSTIREERVLQRDVYIGDFITRLHKYKKKILAGREVLFNERKSISCSRFSL